VLGRTLGSARERPLFNTFAGAPVRPGHRSDSWRTVWQEKLPAAGSCGGTANERAYLLRRGVVTELELLPPLPVVDLGGRGGTCTAERPAPRLA
jgi:hypothetical protein